MKRLIALVSGWVLVASMAHGAEQNPNASAVPAEQTQAAAGEPVLEGKVVERPEGGFLTITMDGPAIAVRFYDAEKKPIAPEVDRAVVRILPASRSPERRVLVRNADGTALTHGQPLRPPFVFKLIITLLREGSEEPVATYNVDFP